MYLCFEQAVKVDVGMEVDLGTALNISQDDCPQLIFIKNGKSVHKLEGTFSLSLVYENSFSILEGPLVCL